MANLILKGNTSGQVTIQAPDEAGTTTLTLPTTNSTLATQNALGVRNLIINGDMRIAQRGTSFTGITSGVTFPVDRWTFQMNSIGTWSASQNTDVPSGQGFANSIKINCTTADASLAAGDYVLATQRIEGQNLQHLKKGTSNAESLTLSFWVKSNKTGTYVIEFRDADNARINCQSYTVNAADTWEKKTITIAGDTSGTLNNDNNLSFEILMWLGAGSAFTSGTLQNSWASSVNANRAVGQVNLADSTSNYINITGVQLEVGDTATPFEHRPYDMELARCQRYYETIGKGGAGGLIVSGNTSSAQQINMTFTYKVTKRATPVVTKVGTWTLVNAPSQPLVYGPDVDNVLLYMLNVNGYGYAQNTANTMYITIEAEL